MDLNRYNKLKSDVDRYNRDTDRAEGAYKQLMTRLKNEFGFDTLEQAEIEAEKMKRQRDKVAKQFDQELEAFDDKWGDKLSDGLSEDET
jgi:hypothetical protein